MRTADRWLIGLVVFLIAIVIAGASIGWLALSRQGRATCYQLRSIEQTEHRERDLASQSFGRVREAHVKSADGLRVYAAGLRAIVPGCPLPPTVKR